MNKQIASNIIQFLDRVSTTGHNERIVMNEAVTALTDIMKAEDEPKKPEKDGKADTK